MFKVETYLNHSDSKGIGVFANQFIPKGTIIWEFVEGFDIKVTPYQIQTLDDVQKRYVDKYFWKEDGIYYSSCDHAKFQNHSSNPNSAGNKFGQMEAQRDIYPNEEITVDYSEFDDDYDSYKDGLIQ